MKKLFKRNLSQGNNGSIALYFNEYAANYGTAAADESNTDNSGEADWTMISSTGVTLQEAMEWAAQTALTPAMWLALLPFKLKLP